MGGIEGGRFSTNTSRFKGSVGADRGVRRLFLIDRHESSAEAGPGEVQAAEKGCMGRAEAVLGGKLTGLLLSSPD